MTKRGILLLALAGAGSLALPQTAAAQQGTYCAVGGGSNSYSNCYYYTFQQCLAAVSGVGGSCQVNPTAGRRSGVWWEDNQSNPYSQQDDVPPPPGYRARTY